MPTSHLTIASWRAIAENSPEVILLLDCQARILYANRTLPEYTTQDAVGREVYEFVAPRHHDMMRQCYQRVLDTGVADRYELDFTDVRGNIRWFSTQVTRRIEQGQVAGLTLYACDITEMRQAQRQLERQKQILAGVIESMADGVAVVDEQGKFLVYNRAAEELVGVIPQDGLSQDWSRHFGLFRADKVTLFPEDELPLRRAALGEKQHEVEVYVKNPSKPEGICLSVNATPLLDEQGQRRGGVAVFRDVTAQKESEQNLKSEQRLLRKLLELQEQERKMISHEIHDGFVQYVVGAKLRLEAAMARGAPGDLTGSDPLSQAVQLLRSAITEARRLISDLRPMVIDDHGIVEAIRHLIAELESRHDLLVEFSAPRSLPAIDGRLRGAMYRVVQEALNNVIRHARTREAQVRLSASETLITLEITDQGAGFEPRDVPGERFGLRSIRERARLFGGLAVIRSQPGQGTSIHVDWPIRESTQS